MTDEEQPVLTIHELSLVKTNPEIEQEISKCPATAKARANGANWTGEKWTDEKGNTYIKETFGDGTGVTFSVDKKNNGTPVTVELPDGRILHNLDDDSYDFFKYQKDIIISRYGQEAYDMFMKYSDYLDSNEAIAYSTHYLQHHANLSEKERMAKIEEELNQGPAEQVAKKKEVFYYLKDNAELYNKICRDNDLRSFGDFFTWTHIYESDSYQYQTKIVKMKNANDEITGQNFPQNQFMDGIWAQYVITIREQSNPANKGAFTGNALNEYRENNPDAFGTWDWKSDKFIKDKDYMKRIHTPPGAKFENTVIDTTRTYWKPYKVIIRKPYEPR